MKLTYLGIIICLCLTITIPNVFAEMDHFLSPGPNSQYKTGDTISFLIEDMPDEDDQSVNANLHKADGSLVKTIKTWSSQSVDDGGDVFPFDWLVDVTETGSYYVEIMAGSSREDITQSYPFQIQGDTESGDAAASTPVDNDPSSDVAPQSIQNEEAQEAQEDQEGSEEPAKNKLSLHNQQSKVAHIASHNDIKTVSEPSSSANEAEPQQIPQNGQQSSSELATPASTDESEPLMPEPGESADMKELVAADNIAVEEEKEWLAKQKKGSSHAPASSPSHEKEPSSDHHSKEQPKHQKTKPDQHNKAEPKKTNSKEHHKATSKSSSKEANKSSSKEANKSSSKPSKKVASSPSGKPASKVIPGINNSKDLKAQIKAKTKESVSKIKEEAQKSNDQEKQRQKLSLAQQEALDDKAIQAEMAEIKSYKSSKEKREAYRQVMRNRARFAKQDLQ